MLKVQRRYNADLWRVLTNESEDTTIVVNIYEIKAISIYQIERCENGELTECIAVNGSTNALEIAFNMLKEY